MSTAVPAISSFSQWLSMSTIVPILQVRKRGHALKRKWHSGAYRWISSTVLYSKCHWPPIHHCCLQQYLPLYHSHHYYHLDLTINISALISVSIITYHCIIPQSPWTSMSPTTNVSTTTSIFNITCYDIIATITTTSTLPQVSQPQSPSPTFTISSIITKMVIQDDCIFTAPPACSPILFYYSTIVFKSTSPLSSQSPWPFPLLPAILLFYHHQELHLYCIVSISPSLSLCLLLPTTTSMVFTSLTITSCFTTTNKSRVQTFIEFFQ